MTPPKHAAAESNGTTARNRPIPGLMTQPSEYQSNGYQTAGYSAANQQPQDGYQTAGYQSDGYRTNGYAAPNQQAQGDYRAAGQQPRRREINPWSVAAIVCVFINPVIALILACIAYKDARRDGVGRGLAKAVIIIGVALIILTILGYIYVYVQWGLF